jgi:diguanylate cyclase (GGDEF)-like protein/PAS domain S-box-containing protein
VDRHDGRPPTVGELVRGVLPGRRTLAAPLWHARHRALLVLLLAHLVLLPFWGALNEEPLGHLLALEAALAVLLVAGAVSRSRAVAASAVSLGLVGAAAAVVHAGDGRTVLHFHFFVVLAALALYQQWLPFLLAIGFVLVDHAVMGLLAPRDVYDDAFSLHNPWPAALVHGSYVLAASAVTAITWTWAERERRTAEERAEQEASRVRESERRLSGLLDNAPSSIFVKDLEGRFIDANRHMQTTLQLPAVRVLGRTSAELFGAEAAQVSDAHDARVVAERRPIEVLERNALGGEERLHAIVKFPLLDDAGEVSAIAGIATDITERLLAEQALRASEQRLRGVFERGPVAQMVLQPDGVLTEVNPAFCELLGYDEAELVGMRFATLVEPEDRPRVGDLLTASTEPRRQELRLRTHDREVRSCRVGVAAVTADDLPHYCVGMVEDVTQARRSEAELAHRATHDGLTGLPNRALLLQRIDEALGDTDAPVAVVFLDLDGFKEVNDSLGHDAGDQLLHIVGQRLQALCRPGDTLARLGGDEFVLCCPGCEQVEQVEAVAERMLEALRTPLALGERQVEVGGSIGIAVGRRGDGSTPMLLLRDADTALYDAKAQGRDRAVLFTPELRDRDERRRRLQADLVAVLRGGSGLVLEYQPVADAATGRVVTCEALVRWDHPQDGRLLPEDFLPLADHKGLLPALDRWVLEQACDAAALWPPHVSVAVNLSPETLADGTLVQWVQEACTRSALSPERLVVELTETAVVSRPQETSRALAGLRHRGVRVALDDFGTGYSSLSHLRDLPVDVVKIDRSFTRGTTAGGRDAAIVQAVADLAGALGATLVAEGVETAAQRAAVVAAGCQLLQGWYVSRPLTGDGVGALLARQGSVPPRPRSTPEVPLRSLG